jgi:hypothetical protein
MRPEVMLLLATAMMLPARMMVEPAVPAAHFRSLQA